MRSALLQVDPPLLIATVPGRLWWPALEMDGQGGEPHEGLLNRGRQQGKGERERERLRPRGQ